LLGIVLALLGTSLGSHAIAPTPFSPSVDMTQSHSVERSLELLDEAHRISRTLRPEQKAWIVFEATDVAAPIDPRRGNEWALEVWQLAKQLTPGQNRIALQKDALRNLAINDPDRALRLYRQQDLPTKWEPRATQLKTLVRWDTRIRSSNLCGSGVGSRISRDWRIWLVFWGQPANTLTLP
jgi:hypothetical protein